MKQASRLLMDARGAAEFTSAEIVVQSLYSVQFCVQKTQLETDAVSRSGIGKDSCSMSKTPIRYVV
jgi:hypothetical protein